MTWLSKPIAIVLFLGFFSNENLYAQETTFSKIDSCYSFIDIYSTYWKKDSLGKNGFRLLMGEMILKGCDFKGSKWKEVGVYLGKPNLKFVHKDSVLYRYRLNYENRSIRVPGAVLLDVEVNRKGIITEFAVYTMDG